MSDHVSAQTMDDTISSFLTDLDQLWSSRQNRLYKIGLAKLMDEYAQAEEKANALYSQIEDQCREHPETLKLINELEDERIHLQTLSNNLFYQQGFRDAVKMLLTTLITD
jgi:FMN phosphatase YigB (HAD superfamily)